MPRRSSSRSDILEEDLERITPALSRTELRDLAIEAVIDRPNLRDLQDNSGYLRTRRRSIRLKKEVISEGKAQAAIRELREEFGTDRSSDSELFFATHKTSSKFSRPKAHPSRTGGTFNQKDTGVAVSQISYNPSLSEFTVYESGKNNEMAVQEVDDSLMGDDVMQDQEATPIVYPLTEECCHYTHVSDVPWDIQKYWHQRHSIFSAYDDGIYMTDDAWFGVTPEPVANKVATDLSVSTLPSKSTIIDIFAGAGGNAIAFALSERWDHVIAIEKNPSVIACAQNNASIYGVSKKITWINDDCFSYVSKANIDRSKTVIFASPPWGGPGYSTDQIFDLSTMQPYSVKQIHDLCKGMDCALYLPRTSDIRQIAKLAPKGSGKIEVVQYCMEGASKALVAYIPADATARP